MNWQRFTLILWWSLLAVFLAITAYYIVFHHVSPLSRDQWHMYDALLTQGVWKTSVTTVSGHRHILAFLLYDIDLKLFAGKNTFLIVVDWLLNAVFIGVLLRQIVKFVPDRLDQQYLAGWTLLLFCWLLNIALLGWGFNGINNYLSIVNTLISILLLHRAVFSASQPLLWMALSIVTGGLATLSFGNGILVWPIGVLCLLLWRASHKFVLIFSISALVFFFLYLWLPGGDAVGNALHLNGWHSLSFPITLMGAPVYHMLRAWHWIPVAWLLPLAAVFGAAVCLAAVFVVRASWLRHEKNNGLQSAALTLILVGFGTVAMLMLTRVEGVLDPTVDRFQIWALLVWFGISVLLYGDASKAAKKIWRIALLLFPLLALPSQLDWGARLAEYRVRVDNALLSFQVYLPVATDAERALHWNWQGKLPQLFPVLESLRATQRNIFADGAAAWLGKPLPAVPQRLPNCPWVASREEPIHLRELLDVSTFLSAERYAVPVSTPDKVVGWRWYGNVAESVWSYGLIADDAGIVRGLLQPVHASLLPRSNGMMYSAGNAYGVARTAQATSLMILNQQAEPLCVTKLH